MSVRYLLKQKLLSAGDDFYIKEEAGNDFFFVDGKAFSIGDKLSFRDLQDNELAFIKQKVPEGDFLEGRMPNLKVWFG